MNPWLKRHLAVFVAPKLKGVKIQPLSSGDTAYFAIHSPAIVQGLIQCWFRAKELAKGGPILLPGRDSWSFQILAKMEGYPTVFRPKLNSGTVKASKEKGILHLFGADCGYNGTVFQNLKLKRFAVTTWKSTTGVNDEHSLNPGKWMDPYVHGLMCQMECYWQHGEVVNGKIVGDFFDPAKIAIIAARTIALVKAIEKEPLWQNRNKVVPPPPAPVVAKKKKRVSK